MAGKKVFDIAIGVTIGLMVLNIFGFAVAEMDDNVGVNGLNSSLNPNGYVDNLSYNAKSSASGVNQQSFNTSDYVVKDSQFIDTRGQGQGNTLSQGYGSSATSFLRNSNFSFWDKKGILTGTLITLIGLLMTLIVLRMMLGENRV